MNNANPYRVEDPTIPTRIDTLLGNGLINNWESNFLLSIKGNFDKYKSLTKGQHETFVKIEERYNADAIAARNAWKAAWDESKAANFASMMKYYLRTPYYRGIVEKWTKDDKYIPAENEYRAVCENKYALKYLKAMQIPAKFSAGQLIVYKEYGNYKLATVIEVGEVMGWAKGHREYKINIVGDAEVRLVNEKDMLYYRQSMNEKLTKDDDVPF